MPRTYAHTTYRQLVINVFLEGDRKIVVNDDGVDLLTVRPISPGTCTAHHLKVGFLPEADEEGVVAFITGDLNGDDFEVKVNEVQTRDGFTNFRLG